MNNNEFQRTENLPFEIDETKKRRKPKNKRDHKKVIVIRSLISVALSLLLVFSLSWTLLYTIVHGPSEQMRDRFVKEAYEKPSTSWIPHLVLPADEIDSIIEAEGE